MSASFGDDGNDLLAATFLIGQAIAAITFPGDAHDSMILSILGSYRFLCIMS